MKNPYKVNTHYFGTHSIISRELKNNESVLDIGCNDGYLKTLTKRNSFYGIDYSKNSLVKAKKNGYIKVLFADLNSYSKVKLNKKFDVIVFADVLEHLLHPEKVLKYFIKNNLKPNGKIIVSLPNVANFMIRTSLLFGKFDYTDAGILDRTHLHLYTTKSALDLIKATHLKVTKTLYASNNFGLLIKHAPFLGSLLGHNIILVCKKK